MPINPDIKLVSFSGASGSGKNTIISQLLNSITQSQLLLSTTSRAARPVELPGEYWHISREDFEHRIQNNEFFEYVEFHHNYYGTLYRSIDNALHSDTLTLMHRTYDKVGAFHEYAPGKIISFFLMTPDEEEHKRRMRERGEHEEFIAGRLAEHNLETDIEALKLPFFIPIKNRDLSTMIAEITEHLQV